MTLNRQLSPLSLLIGENVSGLLDVFSSVTSSLFGAPRRGSVADVDPLRLIMESFRIRLPALRSNETAELERVLGLRAHSKLQKNLLHAFFS